MGDAMGDVMETGRPGLGIEAGSPLWHNLSESLADVVKVMSLDTLTSQMLLVQMVKLLGEGCRVVQKVDGNVQTVDDTDAMSLELGAVRVVSVDTAEQSLGLGVISEQSLEDVLGNDDSSARVLGTPDRFPEVQNLVTVFDRAALMMICKSHSKEGGNHQQ
jgi:hypothetical protein